MKKLIITGFLFVILGTTVLFKDDLIMFIVKHFDYNKQVVELTTKNPYFKEKNYQFVQNTDNFKPRNIQDLLNIYYTVINAGETNFTFYCPDTYEECLTEVANIAENQTTLSHINNFVHPFNGFKNIETEFDSLGKVTITIHHTYSKEEIESLNNEVSRLEKELYTDDMTDQDKIKAVHDYIINTTRYDSNRSDHNIIEYDSEKAIGALFQGVALCGGYTDAMTLFLHNMGIDNYKVASQKHIWNAVDYEGTWYHLDLTWDDPVTSDGSDILQYTFFLINTKKLLSIEDTEHNFNQLVYKEVAQN